MKQKKLRKLPHRNFLVPLVVKKTGAGKHKNKKKEQKNLHREEN
jgi:hypothetical protein